MPEFSVSENEQMVAFDVYCEKCGAALCLQCSTDDRRRKLYVEPCTSCLVEAKDEGYENACIEFQEKAALEAAEA